jgi:hypothetical protein
LLRLVAGNLFMEPSHLDGAIQEYQRILVPVFMKSLSLILSAILTMAFTSCGHTHGHGHAHGSGSFNVSGSGSFRADR